MRRELSGWEKDTVKACQRRLAANPQDELARKVLEDVPNVIQGKNNILHWWLIVDWEDTENEEDSHRSGVPQGSPSSRK